MKVDANKRRSIRVTVIEDDPLRLVGFRSILDPISDFQLTFLPASEIATISGAEVLIVGNHSGLRFFETMTQLRVSYPQSRILVTGSAGDPETIFKAIASGAKGYVQESAPAGDLVKAVYAVRGGSIWAPRRVVSMIIDRYDTVYRPSSQPSWSLTSREKQVLTMLAEGRSNKEIGVPLGIEERTVKAHVAKLMRKVGVRNRIALTVHAVSHSLIAAP